MAMGNEVRPCGFRVMQADRQTDRQTDMVITVLHMDSHLSRGRGEIRSNKEKKQQQIIARLASRLGWLHNRAMAKMQKCTLKDFA